MPLSKHFRFQVIFQRMDNEPKPFNALQFSESPRQPPLWAKRIQGRDMNSQHSGAPDLSDSSQSLQHASKIILT
jgi:hypothetical protein